MQMLMPDQSFNSVSDASAYVPVLQMRKGERTALANATASEWSRMTPVLQVVGDLDNAPPLTDSRVRGWTKDLAGAVGAHTFFVDLVRLPPDRPVRVKSSELPVLRRLHERLRLRRLTFVPVYREEWVSATLARVVSDADALDGRGAAIRLDLRGVSATGATFAARADAAAKLLGVPASRTDLILDGGCIDLNAEPDCDGVAAALQEIAAADGWRNIILVATTMPSTLGGGIVGLGATAVLPRHEWTLWSNVAAQVTDVKVTYGDYGVQHPTPPYDPGGPGMRPNIRYTTVAGTVVVRGTESVQTGGNDEYPELCARLVERSEFAGGDFSWGDRIIEDCAAGEIEPGGQSMWRGAGTSHHVRHVLTELGRHGP